MKTRRTLLTHLALAASSITAIAAALPAHAQKYPERPVRIVVPAPTGNSVDLTARIIAKRLTEKLGQPFVVENRPGNTGHVGTLEVVRSKPDGHTLLVAPSSTLAVSPQVLKGIGYDPVKDLAPIGLLARIPNVLVVHPSLPATTTAEFIQYAKAHPRQLSFASYGVGGNLHLAGELLKLRTGIDALHVPYNASQLAPDLLAGRIQFMFENAVIAMPLVKAGRLRALAVASEDPVPGAESLPPISRTVPGFSVNAWLALLAPANTPPAIVEQIHSEMHKALQSDEMKSVMREQLMIPGDLDPAQTRAFIRSEFDKWAKIVKDTGVRVD